MQQLCSILQKLSNEKVYNLSPLTNDLPDWLRVLQNVYQYFEPLRQGLRV